MDVRWVHLAVAREGTKPRLRRALEMLRRVTTTGIMPWARQDSNLDLTDYESAALTD